VLIDGAIVAAQATGNAVFAHDAREAAALHLERAGRNLRRATG